jgi:hypothetical protein
MIRQMRAIFAPIKLGHHMLYEKHQICIIMLRTVGKYKSRRHTFVGYIGGSVYKENSSSALIHHTSYIIHHTSDLASSQPLSMAK